MPKNWMSYFDEPSYMSYTSLKKSKRICCLGETLQENEDQPSRSLLQNPDKIREAAKLDECSAKDKNSVIDIG